MTVVINWAMQTHITYVERESNCGLADRGMRYQRISLIRWSCEWTEYFRNQPTFVASLWCEVWKTTFCVPVNYLLQWIDMKVLAVLVCFKMCYKNCNDSHDFEHHCIWNFLIWWILLQILRGKLETCVHSSVFFWSALARLSRLHLGCGFCWNSAAVCH